ncbi:hypothetical protein ACIOHR_05940 [Streptomyces anulatus]
MKDEDGLHDVGDLVGAAAELSQEATSITSGIYRYTVTTPMPNPAASRA